MNYCSDRVHHLPAKPAGQAAGAAGEPTEGGQGTADHERVSQIDC